jgi:uncharacterized membrane protein
MEAWKLYVLGLLVVLVGFAMVFVSAVTSSNASFGGVVFIGPVPIVFGSGPNSGVLVLISLATAVTMILVFFVSFFIPRRTKV